MTYCVGVKLDEGLIFASDSRTHAGVDNYATFCKMTVFDRQGDRVLVLLSSGGLAETQTVPTRCPWASIICMNQAGFVESSRQRSW